MAVSVLRKLGASNEVRITDLRKHKNKFACVVEGSLAKLAIIRRLYILLGGHVSALILRFTCGVSALCYTSFCDGEFTIIFKNGDNDPR